MSQILLEEAIKRLEELWPYFERVASEVSELAIQRRIESGLTREQINSNIERALGRYVHEKERT